MRGIAMILMLGLVLVAAVPASARNCRSGMGDSIGMMAGEGCISNSEYRRGTCNGACSCRLSVLPLLDSIDLSESQLDEIEEILADADEAVLAAKEDAGLADPFITVFASPSFSVSSLEDLASRSDLLREEIEDIHNETLVSIHGVLTGEQLAELASLAEENMHDGGRGMGRHGGNPCGAFTGSRCGGSCR